MEKRKYRPKFDLSTKGRCARSFTPRPLYPRKKSLRYIFFGPQKQPGHCEKSNPNSSPVQPVARRFADWNIPAAPIQNSRQNYSFVCFNLYVIIIESQRLSCWSPCSSRGGQRSIPRQFIRDLWWTNWHWGRFALSTLVSLPAPVPPTATCSSIMLFRQRC